MKIRFVVLPLMLATALFLAGGCADKGDPAWGEKQKVLLEELLNKPNVKHGELVIDHKKKEWVIPNLEITLGDEEFSSAFCSIESVTGVDVMLEPITEENGLLAGRLEIKGLVCRDDADPERMDVEFKQDSFVVENLKGSKELQEVLLSFGDKASLGMLKQANVDGLSVQGVNLLDDEGVSRIALESFALKNLAGGFVGPVELKKLVVAPETRDFDSLSVGFMGIKKVGSKTLFDAFVKLLEEHSASDFYTMYIASMNMVMQMDYEIEGMEYRDIAITFDKSVPPMAIKKVTGAASFDGKKGFSNSKMENITIAPETLQHLGGGMFAGYAYKPVDLSGEGEATIELIGDVYTADYKKFNFSDPQYGSFDINFSMSLPAEAFTLDPYTHGYEGALINNFYLSFEDKALTDTLFDLAALSEKGSVEGAGAMRESAAAAVKIQCAQLPAGLQGACNNTAEFLEKKGRIEYTFKPESPLALDATALGKLGEINIESKVTPAK